MKKINLHEQDSEGFFIYATNYTSIKNRANLLHLESIIKINRIPSWIRWLFNAL
jgi:hypothetical protein